MSMSIIRRRWRTAALSLALALAVTVGACGPTLRVQSQTTRVQNDLNYQLVPVTPMDKYIDPRTGISRPDNPALNGG